MYWWYIYIAVSIYTFLHAKFLAVDFYFENFKALHIVNNLLILGI